MNNANPELFWDAEVSSRLLALVKEAGSELLLVSPYLDLWGNIERELTLAAEKGVKITVIVRKDLDRFGGPDKFGGDKGSTSIAGLISIGADVRAVENLHAKVYLSDKATLVSSMNLTEASTGNSLEVGMAVQNDGALAASVRQYVTGHIIPFAQPIPKNGPQPVVTHAPVSSPKRPTIPHVGKCIRCGRPLFLDPAKPLCDDCYGKWAQYEDEKYQERFCHACGKESDTSYARPLCSSCYRRTQ